MSKKFEKYIGKVMEYEEAYNTFIDHEYIMVDLKRDKDGEAYAGKVVCVSNDEREMTEAMKPYWGTEVDRAVLQGRDSVSTITELGGI